MQLVRQHSDDIASKASDTKATEVSLNKDPLELMLTATIGLAALMAFLLLLPQGLALFTYESDGWIPAGILLTFVVLTAVKGLETLLDC